MKTLATALLVCFLALPLVAQTPLVSAGRAGVVIVIPEKPAPPEQRAADELRTTLSAIAGVSFSVISDADPVPPAAILVGPTRPTADLLKTPALQERGSEAFLLRTDAGHTILLGNSPRATMYAATALLEKLGVRYFTPTVTRIPKDPGAVLPKLDEIQSPAFEYREVYFTEAFEKNWAAHLRLNGQSQHLDASTGGKVTYYPFVHTFDALIPPSLFATHPEYFPLIKGKRTAGYVQRCLSNPEVLQLAIRNVRQWIAEHPNAMIYSVSQNDTYNVCECDACRAIEARYGNTHSGLYLWFVNQIAAAIEKDHPDKLIDTLAYQFTERAPTGIVPRRNVRVRLCPIAVCEAHPYEQCTAPTTVAFMKALNQWSKITSTLYIWHYNTDFAHYLLPFPDFNEFPADLRLYQRSGVRGIFFEGAYGPGGGGSDAELRSYVMAQLLWNPQLDARPIEQEWMTGVYGPAAAPMLAWFDLLHQTVKDPNHHFFIYDPPTVYYMSREVMHRGDELFDEAARLAANDPVAAAYVAKSRLWLRYTKIAQDPKRSPDLEPFLADLQKLGIQHIGEGRPVSGWAQGQRRKPAP